MLHLSKCQADKELVGLIVPTIDHHKSRNCEYVVCLLRSDLKKSCYKIYLCTIASEQKSECAIALHI